MKSKKVNSLNYNNIVLQHVPSHISFAMSRRHNESRPNKNFWEVHFTKNSNSVRNVATCGYI